MGVKSTKSIGKLKTCFIINVTLVVIILFIVQLQDSGWHLKVQYANQRSKNFVARGQGHIDKMPRKEMILTATDVPDRSEDESRLRFDMQGSRTMTDDTGKKSDGNNITAVLLLTYMRSGSSLTGEILTHSVNDAFYLFEPLKQASKNLQEGKPISYLNGTILTPGIFDIQNVYLETLLGWFSCNMSRVYLESLLDVKFLSLGKGYGGYIECLNNLQTKHRVHLTHSLLKNTGARKVFIKCLNRLQNTCLNSKYRVIKSIRTNMTFAKDILEHIDGSKVVHLIRDPRATLESKRHTNGCPDDISHCIDLHCHQLRVNTAVQGKLEMSNPGRFYTVRYEDIATNPIETVKSTFSFIGLEFTPSFANFVYDITLGEDKDGCTICKKKWQLGNSSLSSETHVDAWKQKLPPFFINQTQHLCDDVIKYYGYEQYMVPYMHRSNDKILQRNSTILHIIKGSIKELQLNSN